jgi:hypothetical protein
MGRPSCQARFTLVAGIFALALWALPRPTHAAVSLEYKLKALVVFSLAKFVEWPPETFGSTNSPLIIGILGDDPFESVLEEIIQGRAINGRSLTIKRSRDVEELTTCHILFVSPSERDRESQILSRLDGLSVLTVSDSEQFLPDGGIIRLKMKQQKVRFNISAPAAKRARLKLSSQLLSLATDNREAD